MQDFYEIERRTLGKGAFGTVRAGFSIRGAARSPCAIKSMKTSQVREGVRTQLLSKEIDVMKGLDHINIVRLLDFFEEPTRTHVVMELCAGGNLLHFIDATSNLSEAVAAMAMRQVFVALEYMHARCICHRDIKAENVLMASLDPIQQNTLKVGDFGLACACGPGDKLKLVAGTPYYMAPQVINGRYDRACDLWSCGVLAYLLLCGYPPFEGESESVLFCRVRRGNYVFSTADWTPISERAKCVIRALLKMNPRERMRADEALCQDWLREREEEEFAEAVQLQSTISRLRVLRGKERLGKVAREKETSQGSADNRATSTSRSQLQQASPAYAPSLFMDGHPMHAERVCNEASLGSLPRKAIDCLDAAPTFGDVSGKVNILGLFIVDVFNYSVSCHTDVSTRQDSRAKECEFSVDELPVCAQEMYRGQEHALVVD
jgi:calcium-dependent protein kinase